MKKIAVFCVNYHSYKILYDYLQSIDVATGNIDKNDVEVEVHVADNSTEHIEDIVYKGKNISVKAYPYHKNLGYFGAIGKMTHEVDTRRFDYSILSNVDLLMTPETIRQILNYPCPEHIGWIAPEIYSLREKRDLNPQAVCRYSRKKLLILRMMFKHSFLYDFYKKTLYGLYKKKAGVKEFHENIYAGHGSFMILTKAFFNEYKTIDYPVFLCGEEIHLAELCRKARLSVVHIPSIKIQDLDHYSTGKMKRKFNYFCNFQALDYIIKTYY